MLLMLIRFSTLTGFGGGSGSFGCTLAFTMNGANTTEERRRLALIGAGSAGHESALIEPVFGGPGPGPSATDPTVRLSSTNSCADRVIKGGRLTEALSFSFFHSCIAPLSEGRRNKLLPSSVLKSVIVLPPPARRALLSLAAGLQSADWRLRQNCRGPRGISGAAQRCNIISIDPDWRRINEPLLAVL